MPHLQLELSRDVAGDTDLGACLADLIEAFATIPTVDPASIKAYVRVAETWSVGRGHPPGFIHLTVCVLEGRPADLLSEMAAVLHGRLLVAFRGTVDAGRAGLTCEIREMAASTYRKTTASGRTPGAPS